MRRYVNIACLCLLTATAGAQSFQQIELNKDWQFSSTDENTWRSATVPGTVHTDLMAHHLIPDPYVGMNEKSVQWVDKKNWQYKTTFSVTKEMLQHDWLALDFKGLDTYVDIYINDDSIASSANMFVPLKAQIKQKVKEGNNTLRLVFHSPIRHDMHNFLNDDVIYPAGNDASDIPLSVYARKAPYHYGWDWGPRLVTSGIWRPVYLEYGNKASIEDVYLQQKQLTDKSATILAQLKFQTTTKKKYTVKIESPDKLFAAVTKQYEGDSTSASFTIAKPRRWWPNGLGEQFLYKVNVSLYDGTELLQSRALKIGLRTLEVVNKPDSMGVSFFVKVNGRPVFMKGADYIPLDNFLPRVTNARFAKLFADMKTSHFNMVRVWGGGTYEEDRFYELADENGILVWQDLLFACSTYPTPKILKSVAEELAANITRLRNHPSLALWCGNNEIGVAIDHWGWKEGYGYTEKQWADMKAGYDEFFNVQIPKIIQQFDTERFYFPSSPISNWSTKKDFTIGDNHYWGVWHGMEWFEAFDERIPRFMSEYGFQSFPDIQTVKQFTTEKDRDIYSPVMLSHQKSLSRGNAAIKTYLLHYYKEPKDFESFLYVNHVLQAEGMKMGIEAHRRAMPFCMGTLYWQLDDCWPGPSWSSIDYYGRWKAMQYFVKKAYTPVLVSNTVKNANLKTYIISDEIKDQKATLQMKLMDFAGRVLWEKSLDVNIVANKSVVVHEISLDSIMQPADSGKVILYTKVVNGDKLWSENVYYFAKTKDLELPDPEMEIAYPAFDTTATGIVITAKKLAKNVFLQYDDPEVQFSDNYFDLLPGEKRQIWFNKKVPADKLKVISLRDTFKN
ncbi:beta-mannosidase [Chitinophaga sancti]|uniref:Beta-mannosidase B n=1 Tax=Chitinophaga sancti TaxID=1004 RepID=A0A1K1PEH9_9BACT|nr:glycoside hydrolase family 2 protein [Chitinophaga sancti]WQD65820.1 glycoside hydrolase family 2 protein [Chitinophaga sancti]WQG88558.1 glycoside hydrolase family 2 protein [Chitinophaga sancti]SFW45991.1 beta-mannosidase [Chitinophaga sancti]